MSAAGNKPFSGAGPAVDQARTIAPFLGFAALLRRAGFAVAPEQVISWLSGIELLGPRGIGDIRRAAHATLAPPPERSEEFDALFDAHFLGAVQQGLEAAPDEEEEPRAADDSAGGPEPIFGEDELESGAEATAAEKLAARRFAATDEDQVLRSFARAVPARLPRRRGYRFRSARGGQAYDARRMFRDAMRHAGELVNLRWRKRRQRQRRIVVLIDVSGSMKERTQAHLTFAHALTRAADAVEVFTIGTRLTRVTRALHLRNREQALAAASRVGGRLGRRHAHRRGARRLPGRAAFFRAGAWRGHRRALRRPRARRPGRDARRGRALVAHRLAHRLADAARRRCAV